MSGALRFNHDKLDMTIVPTEVTMIHADLFQAGAVKYARDNWRKGFADPNTLPASLLRHYSKAVMGEVYDQEIGTLHWTQVAWNANLLAIDEMYGRLGRPVTRQASFEEIESVMRDQRIRDEYIKASKELD